MRIIERAIYAIAICSVAGCSLWQSSPPSPPSPPAPTKKQIVLHGVVDFDKAQIRPASLPVIQEAATKLGEQGNLGVVVEGHSDSKGTVEHNQKLSLRRAQKVTDELVRLGVDRGRIVVIGKGASEPIASNETKEGRAQNRRVVLVIYRP